MAWSIDVGAALSVPAACADAALRGGLRHAESGVLVLHRHDQPEIEAVERSLAETQRLTRVIKTWESCRPTNICREALRRRAEARRTYAALSGVADLCITLAASGAAPIGIASTGNPAFAAPSSLLGVPALSLPLLEDDSLPLGLQALGFEQRDADLFGYARAVVDLVPGRAG